jgi:hypothetical protein
MGFGAGAAIGGVGAFVYLRNQQALKPGLALTAGAAWHWQPSTVLCDCIPPQPPPPPSQPPAAPIQNRPRPPGGRAVSLEDLGHPALKFGMPQTEHLRFFSGFVSCFDGATRNPKWVLERVSQDALQGQGTR